MSVRRSGSRPFLGVLILFVLTSSDNAPYRPSRCSKGDGQFASRRFEKRLRPQRHSGSGDVSGMGARVTVMPAASPREPLGLVGTFRNLAATPQVLPYLLQERFCPLAQQVRARLRPIRAGAD